MSSQYLRDNVVDKLINAMQIKKEDVDKARIIQKRKNIGLDKALIESGAIKEEDVLSFLVQELNIPFINLNKYKIDPSLQEVISARVARQYQIIPLSALQYTITIATSDPLNIFLVDDLKNITGRDVDLVMSPTSDIIKALDVFYGTENRASVNELTKDIQLGDFEIVSEKDEVTGDDTKADEGEKAPIIRMVNLIIKEALRQRTSDIHIEPMVDCMRVRYRIDGSLLDILTIPKENQNAVTVRIKIMSRLDITANQVPQDGRFKLQIANREVDFRVSLLPTTFGQKVVLRILDKGNLSVGLEGLGISEKSYKWINECIHKPFGMILVTGPTGSGKSTTLYSILNDLNTPDKNVVTVEDPVEYLVDGLTQIQTKAEIGYTFSEGLRAILRQSPDIVMVGEIRDNETADISIKASLTGQLVLSTLHTNDASGALTRLVDMGVEPFLVASSIILVTAQRLCRKICPNCKEPLESPGDLFEELKMTPRPGAVFYYGKGCEMCRQTGYLGRTSITEVLVVDDPIREMLLKGESSDAIKMYARKTNGMDTLWDDVWDKAYAGVTSLEEVLRVTSKD
ncbi:MAG: GspE/PulE family protein [Candidatus Omnitrophica bacterium]|nr:GspE/PulE family protein [Candidatus Omnitrophota bacterium]